MRVVGFLLLLLPLGAMALDAQITKDVDQSGQLQAVVITTKDVIIRVNVYGYIENVVPNNPKIEKLNELNKIAGVAPTPYPNPVVLQYSPPSSMDGNGGKISSINGIPVAYYTCTAANQTLNGVQYYGQNMSPAANNSATSPLTVNPRYKNACQSVSSNGGKLRSIGDLNFSYYSDTYFANANSGKLQRVGDIVITYYSTGSFQGQGGQLQSFGS